MFFNLDNKEHNDIKQIYIFLLWIKVINNGKNIRKKVKYVEKAFKD